MISVSVSIDVPSLADGIRFYSEAFGFSKKAEPVPGVVVVLSANRISHRLGRNTR